MFWLIKKLLMGLLISIVNASNPTKGASLSNQEYVTQPTLNNLHPNEYSQVLHYHIFAVKLDKFVGSCGAIYLIEYVFK